jgi:diketogulonate reductase-like aldo/keto reductase
LCDRQGVLDLGINVLDTASAYLLSEERIGKVRHIFLVQHTARTALQKVSLPSLTYRQGASYF